MGQTITLKLSGETNVKWSTTNKSIATVSSKGVVKAVKKGICSIKAIANKKTYKCKITVKIKPITLKKGVYGYEVMERYHRQAHSVDTYAVRFTKTSTSSLKFSVTLVTKNFNAYYKTSTITASVKDNKASFSWKDNWGNKGTGTIKLKTSERISLTMKETYRAAYNKATLKCSSRILDYDDSFDRW